MRNQCICLTCYKQHEKAISRGTGPNRVRNQKQHYKSMGATDFYPPPPALSAGESFLNMCSVGKRIKNNTPEAGASIREYCDLMGTAENQAHTQMCRADAYIHALDILHNGKVKHSIQSILHIIW